MNFDNYQLEQSVYDEMFEPGGAPREHCRELHETLDQLSAEQLSSIQERVTRSFSNEGISFTIYGDEEGEERIIRVDCLPRVLPGAEWRRLEKGLDQRINALNLFLEDVYGEARIINDGVIPVDVVRDCPQYRVEMRGFSAPPGRLGCYLRHRPGQDQRWLHGAGRQPEGPFRRLIHDCQPQGGEGQPASAL